MEPGNSLKPSNEDISHYSSQYEQSLRGYKEEMFKENNNSFEESNSAAKMKCYVCDFFSANKTELKKHAKIHVTEKPFECSTCGYATSWKFSLQRHIKTVHIKEKPFKCEHCEYSSPSKQGLVIHIRKHSGDRPFQCNYTGEQSTCSARLRDRNSLLRHIRSVHNKIKAERKFDCDQCDYKAHCSSTLVVHIRKHTGEKPFGCEKCDYKSTSKAYLTQHVKIHSEEKDYPCSMCEFKTNSASTLWRHSKTHNKVKPYVCSQCEHRTKDKTSLTSHYKHHNHEAPFKCEGCVYSVSSQSALTMHLFNGHIGKVPYKCTIDGFRTAVKTELKKHMSTHISNKPVRYRCEKCLFENPGYPQLVQHMRGSHTAIDQSDAQESEYIAAQSGYKYSGVAVS